MSDVKQDNIITDRLRQSILMPYKLPEKQFTRDIKGEQMRASIPNTPPGIDKEKQIEQNAKEAHEMFPWDYYKAVKGGGKWDYKRQDPNPANSENYGNFNYGVTGRSFLENVPFISDRLRKNILLRVAGGVHQLTNPTHKEYGGPFGKPPYGDDPKDQAQIEAGSNYYEYLKNRGLHK